MLVTIKECISVKGDFDYLIVSDWRHFIVVTVQRVVLFNLGREARMLLNIRQCKGRLLAAKNYLAPNIISAQIEKLPSNDLVNRNIQEITEFPLRNKIFFSSKNKHTGWGIPAGR